jgi:hypothetical protein
VGQHFYAFWAEKVLTKKARKQKETDYEMVRDNEQDRDKILKELNEFHQQEKGRKGTVEDKAKACLFIIALTITLILGSLNFIKGVEPGTPFYLPGIVILIIGVIFLFLSGITAIKALNVREYHDIQLHNRVREDGTKLNIIKEEREERISLLYKIIKLNQLTTNIRSNYVYATFIGIRNGIILISIFFILAVTDLYIHNQTPDKKAKDKTPGKTTITSEAKPEKKTKEPAEKSKDPETSPETKTKEQRNE